MKCIRQENNKERQQFVTEKYFSIYDQDNSSHSLYIKDGGNIGIGTTNPDQKLEIFNGALKFGTNTTGLNEFEIFPTFIQR